MIEADLTHREEVEAMREAIVDLKEQERMVLSLYYFEELKLHEIGKIIELTESRVSQIRSRAVAKLRTRMLYLRYSWAVWSPGPRGGIPDVAPRPSRGCKPPSRRRRWRGGATGCSSPRG